MSDSAKYYEEKLYPLQNGVLNIVNNAKTPFFLTGGTALSRYYTHHRYSDDLDFFVNQRSDYSELVDIVLERLIAAETQGAFAVDRASLNKGTAYTQVYITMIEQPDVELKVEFINDIAQHYGDIVTVPVLGRVDSLRNILSNKLTALFRSEPKDIADIYVIALLQKDIDWREIVLEAKSKEVGADPEVIHDILRSFPVEQLNRIRWIKRPDFNAFSRTIGVIAEDILYGRNSSL